jgi:hypothetical protein
MIIDQLSSPCSFSFPGKLSNQKDPFVVPAPRLTGLARLTRLAGLTRLTRLAGLAGLAGLT